LNFFVHADHCESEKRSLAAACELYC